MWRFACSTLPLLAAFSFLHGCTLLNRDLRSAYPCSYDVSNGLPAPTLFAHRGGAREAPESTMVAFQHAVQAGADVLELDVRLTRDGEFVVWHGPALDNVRIQGVDDCPCKRPCGRKKIGDYYWSELAGRAAVADPPFHPEIACTEGRCSLADITFDEPGRHLILFKDFLAAFPCRPLNVEIKDFCVSPAAIAHFVDILEHAPRCQRCDDREQCTDAATDTLAVPARTIMVASANDLVQQEFRRQTSGRYQTNIPLAESLLPPPIIPRVMRKTGRALQVPRWWIASGSWAVSNFHRAGAAVHVFITKFLWSRGLDEEPSQVDQTDIDALLDRNVDGLMTDRPCEVRPLIDDWLERRGCPVNKEVSEARRTYCEQTLARRQSMPPPPHCSCGE